MELSKRTSTIDYRENDLNHAPLTKSCSNIRQDISSEELYHQEKHHLSFVLASVIERFVRIIMMQFNHR
jgi:hypothetical protein